jgi:hypothetical protein
MKEDSMRDEKDILEQYRHADMARRLNLYLQYREYRDEFLLMDMEKNNIPGVETAVSCSKHHHFGKEKQAKPFRKFLIHVFACR